MDCFPSSIIPHLSSNYNSWYGLYHKNHTDLHLIASFFPKLFFFPLWVKVICSKDSFEGFGFITKIPVLLSTFLLLMVSEWRKRNTLNILGAFFLFTDTKHFFAKAWKPLSERLQITEWMLHRLFFVINQN